jgi:hypothetical protein
MGRFNSGVVYDITQMFLDVKKFKTKTYQKKRKFILHNPCTSIVFEFCFCESGNHNISANKDFYSNFDH